MHTETTEDFPPFDSLPAPKDLDEAKTANAWLNPKTKPQPRRTRKFDEPKTLLEGKEL